MAPPTKCFHYNEDGTPRKRGCTTQNCAFVHPNDTDWENARMSSIDVPKWVYGNTDALPNFNAKKKKKIQGGKGYSYKGSKSYQQMAYEDADYDDPTGSHSEDWEDVPDDSQIDSRHGRNARRALEWRGRGKSTGAVTDIFSRLDMRKPAADTKEKDLGRERKRVKEDSGEGSSTMGYASSRTREDRDFERSSLLVDLPTSSSSTADRRRKEEMDYRSHRRSLSDAKPVYNDIEVDRGEGSSTMTSRRPSYRPQDVARVHDSPSVTSGSNIQQGYPTHSKSRRGDVDHRDDISPSSRVASAVHLRPSFGLPTPPSSGTRPDLLSMAPPPVPSLDRARRHSTLSRTDYDTEMAYGLNTSERAAQDSERLWKDRLKLLSASGSASENIAALKAEIKTGAALLNSDFFYELDDSQQTRLRHEHETLHAQLDAEMTRYRGLNMALESPEPGGSESQSRETRPPQTDVKEHLKALNDKAMAMKNSLAEMQGMTRAKQEMIKLQSSSRLKARKRDLATSMVRSDDDDRDDEDMNGSAGASDAPTPADVHALRDLLVEYQGQITEIEEDVRYAYVDSEDVRHELLEVKLDNMRAQRAAASHRREILYEKEKADMKAEVMDGFTQVGREATKLDEQIGEIAGTLAGLVLQVDSLEGMIDQDRNMMGEGRRVEQIQEKMQSYADLQEQNAVAIKTLRTALDACTSRPASPASPPSISVVPDIYPSTTDIAHHNAPNMVDVALPLVEHIRSEVTGMLQKNWTEVQCKWENVNAISEALTAKIMEIKAAHAQAEIQSLPPPTNDVIMTIGDASSTSRRRSPSGPPPQADSFTPPEPRLPLSVTPIPPLDVASARSPTPARQALPSPTPSSLRYTPPPSAQEVIPMDVDDGTDAPSGTTNLLPTSSLNPLVGSSSVLARPQTDTDNESSTIPPEVPSAASDLDVVAVKMEQHTDVDLKFAGHKQLDCSFLTDPTIDGMPVRLQPSDQDLLRPFVFVKTVSSPEDEGSIMVEVRRNRPKGTTFQFPLEDVRYLPPTTSHQHVICVAPGENHSQRYYVLKFDREKCVVRKDPKVLNDKNITIATHTLAQVAATWSAQSVQNKSLSTTTDIKPVLHHYDHPPPIWLKEPDLASHRVQLREQDGDGSTLEFLRFISITESTIEVKPLSSGPRRKMLLENVRHVIPSAAYQLVVPTTGDSKGMAMKVGTYGSEECTLYTPGKRRMRQPKRHLEPSCKTADLAVICPPQNN